MADKQAEYDYHGGQRDHYVGGSQTGLNRLDIYEAK